MNQPPAIHAPAAIGIDLSRLLLALTQVENPAQDPFAVGPRGERGLWQMKKEAWQQVSGWPYRYVTDPIISRSVAREYLLWLESELARDGVRATPMNLILAWKCGESGFANRKYLPQGVKDAAQRCLNLYHGLNSTL
jgi:hypothetical protein